MISKIKVSEENAMTYLLHKMKINIYSIHYKHTVNRNWVSELGGNLKSVITFNF